MPPCPGPSTPHQRPGASNAWAAAPSRSAAGSTLLASDPHLGFSAPAIWYLARIELETGGVIGGTIPGIPAVLAGRSAGLGWGLTASYVDDQDIVIEALNPENANEVRTPTAWVYGWRSACPSILTIADAPPETIELAGHRTARCCPYAEGNRKDQRPRDHVADPRLARRFPEDDTTIFRRSWDDAVEPV